MSGKSLRAQVVEDIREKIATGVWPPGHQLPTKRDLAKMYEVSQAVIDAAMIELRADGIVRGQQGKGVYVAEKGA
jgi:DNA-binding GntR family transcriptional regulator